MIKNYFKTAWRNLTKNKVYSSIHITGLAIALAGCMIIILYVEHELSYDRFHANANRICWIQGKVKMGNDSIFVPNMSYATAPIAKQNEPFIESYVRYIKGFNHPVIKNIQSQSVKFSDDNFLFADSNFFNFFSFKLLKGNKNQVLQSPFTVVISKEAAKKYFGNKNPVGKIISYNDAYNFTITGVAETAPSNSSIDYDFVASLSSIASMDAYKKLTESQYVQLGSFTTYFLVRRPKDILSLDTRLLQLHHATTDNKESGESYIATPLTSTHLYANYGDASGTKYLKIFSLIAVLILLLALTNYTSLSTARATIRAKEIGVRKVMGANRKSIAIQFFIESVVYTVVAFVLAYFLCIIFQPSFFNFLQIDIDPSFLHSSYLLLSYAALFMITAVLASTYPSLLLSTFKPVKVLYGKFRQNTGLGIRRFLTVFQFTISVALVICGIVISKQMYFFRHADTGVNRENIVMIPFATSIGKHYSAFKKEVASLAGVEQTTTAHYPMYKGYDMFFTKAKESNEDVALPVFSVDENFIPMLGLQWKIPPFDSLFSSGKEKVIINEAAISKLNLDNNPMHEKIAVGTAKYEIAGVLKNFNYQSLQIQTGALCLFVSADTASKWGEEGGCLFTKIKPHVNIPTLLQQVQSIYEKYDKEQPFTYYFMDDTYDAMYKAEDRLSKILNVFTAFTIFIACLGLFGLVTFMAVQRTKEIGIRKVLGASAAELTALLSKDFLKLIVIAIIIASPIAWWATNKWLQNFAYRIHVSWWMFLMAAIITIVVALVTVSFQTIKAAMANPVKSLRSE